MWRHDEEFITQTQRKRVRIHHNGDFENGKDLLVEPDWNIKDFLNACSLRLGTSSHKRVFNSDGHDIDDCMMIEDNDILFLSNGDDFIPPGADGGSVLYLKNGNTWETIPTMISGYKIGKLLGRGGFGEVRMGEHQLTKEKVALKFLRKAEIMSMGAAERTTTEIQCLSALKHAHIIRLTQHVESPHHVVLVFELMEGGDLYNYLLNRQLEAIKASTDCISSFQYALPEDEARHVFSQVISAIGYAHNQHICHRDLKLENILLKSTNLSCIKIADFGLSAFYRPGAHMKSSCGTLSFLAPEVFAGTSNAGPPLDVWALGVILFAILCGRLPFEGPDLAGTKRPRDAVIRSRISKAQYKIEEGLSPEAKDLVRRMLRVDPSIRATVPEIFSHVWMRSSSQSYDPYNTTTTTIKERELVSPLSLIQKLSLNSPPPVPLTPPPALIEKTSNGTDSRISTPRSSLKLPIIATPTTGVDEDIDHDETITRKSSSETELDNLPVFDTDRALNKLRSNSTDDSIDDIIETVSTGRRSSAKPDISEPDENSYCASPKSSLVLVPLRRNPQSSAKDTIPSPRRPKTAIEDDDFLVKFRAESWDVLQDDLPSTAVSTARGRGSITEGESHTRIRQSTGSLSARLHPLQLRKQEHNNNNNHNESFSNSNSTTSSPSSGVHTGRSYNSSRKTLVQSNNNGNNHNNNISSSAAATTTWTEQLEETKEILESSYLNGGSGKHSKNTDSTKGNYNQTLNDHISSTSIHVNNNNGNNNNNQSRSKHSQLHLAGSSSLKPHSVSITVTSSSSQPSTPQQTIRRKMPSAISTSSSTTPQRSSFTSSQSTNERSPPPSINGTGQGMSAITGTSYTNPNFLSSMKRNSIRSSSSGRLSKTGGEITIEQSSSKNI